MTDYFNIRKQIEVDYNRKTNQWCQDFTHLLLGKKLRKTNGELIDFVDGTKAGYTIELPDKYKYIIFSDIRYDAANNLYRINVIYETTNTNQGRFSDSISLTDSDLVIIAKHLSPTVYNDMILTTPREEQAEIELGESLHRKSYKDSYKEFLQKVEGK